MEAKNTNIVRKCWKSSQNGVPKSTWNRTKSDSGRQLAPSASPLAPRVPQSCQVPKWRHLACQLAASVTKNKRIHFENYGCFKKGGLETNIQEPASQHTALCNRASQSRRGFQTKSCTRAALLYGSTAMVDTWGTATL